MSCEKFKVERWDSSDSSFKDGRIYVGYARDFEKRFLEHKSGKVRSTAYRRSRELIKLERFDSIRDAKARELWWKSSSGRLKLKELFQLKAS